MLPHSRLQSFLTAAARVPGSANADSTMITASSTLAADHSAHHAYLLLLGHPHRNRAQAHQRGAD
jgi:hypothetical protein